MQCLLAAHTLFASVVPGIGVFCSVCPVNVLLGPVGMQPLALPDMFERLEDCTLRDLGLKPLRKTARAFAGAEYWFKQRRKAC